MPTSIEGSWLSMRILECSQSLWLVRSCRPSLPRQVSTWILATPPLLWTIYLVGRGLVILNSPTSLPIHCNINSNNRKKRLNQQRHQANYKLLKRLMNKKNKKINKMINYLRYRMSKKVMIKYYRYSLAKGISSISQCKVQISLLEIWAPGAPASSRASTRAVTCRNQNCLNLCQEKVKIGWRRRASSLGRSMNDLALASTSSAGWCKPWLTSRTGSTLSLQRAAQPSLVAVLSRGSIFLASLASTRFGEESLITAIVRWWIMSHQHQICLNRRNSTLKETIIRICAITVSKRDRSALETAAGITLRPPTVSLREC